MRRSRTCASMGERKRAYGAGPASGKHQSTSRPGAPHIDAGEQEQPDHVDKVPVPGGKLESEVLGGGEMAEIGADQADNQERGADDHMGAMKAGRHEKSGAIDVAAEIKGGMAVLIGLDGGEGEAERNSEDEPPFEPLAIVFQERMVRPGYGGAGSQQDERVKERQVPWIQR